MSMHHQPYLVDWKEFEGLINNYDWDEDSSSIWDDIESRFLDVRSLLQDDSLSTMAEFSQFWERITFKSEEAFAFDRSVKRVFWDWMTDLPEPTNDIDITRDIDLQFALNPESVKTIADDFGRGYGTFNHQYLCAMASHYKDNHKMDEDTIYGAVDHIFDWLRIFNCAADNNLGIVSFTA